MSHGSAAPEAPPTLTSIPDGAESRSGTLNAVYIGMIVPATIVVAIRLGWKYFQPKGLGLDDLCIFIALVVDFVHTALGLTTVHYGFGHHALDIPPPDLRKALMLWFGCQVVYKILVGFTKLAMVFLYLRVFPQRWLKRSCWAVAAVVFVGSVAFSIANVFPCKPIHKLWDRKTPGKCFNLGASWFAYAAFNALCDIVIILLPIYPVWQLQIKWTQKAAIAGVFLTGAFVCFTSIMRIVALPGSIKSHEPTWGAANAVIWAEIEGGVGIIVACLPVLRAPLVKAYRKLSGSIASTSKGSENYNEFHDSESTVRGGNATRTFKADPKMDYWGDGIPLSTSEAHRTPSLDQDNEEKALGGITKTVELQVTDR